MTPDLLQSSLPESDPPDFNESMSLVRRFQDGDDAALNQLLERYQERLQRIVRIRLGSRLRAHIESMDIVQEASMVAMRKLGDFQLRDNASILRWLSQIVLNQIRDVHQYFDAERRDVGRVVSLEPTQGAAEDTRPALQLAGDDPLPEELAWRSELREILDDSMTKLTDEYREMVLRRDYYGEDWATIAHELGYVARQGESASSKERLDRAIHAAQEFHRRAWIKLRQIVRPRLDGLMGSG